MTEWSKHVHRFAKKHNMSYKQANRSRRCKETYKKRKTSPRRKSPRRKTSPGRKRRMNISNDDDTMKNYEDQRKRDRKGWEKFQNSEHWQGMLNESRGYTSDDVDILKQYLKAEGLTEEEARIAAYNHVGRYIGDTN